MKRIFVFGSKLTFGIISRGTTDETATAERATGIETVGGR